MKVAQQPQNPAADAIRFELRPQVRKIHERPPRSLYKTLLKHVATAAAGSNIPICRYQIKGCSSGKKNTSQRPQTSEVTKNRHLEF